MKKRLAAFLLVLPTLIPLSALAAPRDADAVLNRCGKPLKGDETVLDNSAAGGHRLLRYERGTLLFNREENTGWTFVSGEHKGSKDLTASQMSQWMPCLPLALADSASPAPLKQVSEMQRVEVSAKASYKALVAGVLAFLVLLGVVFYLLSLRKPGSEEGVVS